jgi:predicted metal-binding membrane protein
MLMLVALGVMSVAWMSVIAVLILGQKCCPRRPPSMRRWRWRSFGLGILIVLAPWSVPGLAPPM